MFVTSRALRANHPGTQKPPIVVSHRKKTDTTKHNPPNYGDNTVVLFFVLSKREKRERERES